MAHKLKIELNNWLIRRKITIEELNRFAQQLDEIQKNFDGTKFVGKSSVVLKSSLVFLGTLGSPFTGGASLAALGMVGAGLCLGSTIGQRCNEHDMVEKVKKVADADYEKSMRLKNLLHDLYVDEQKPPQIPPCFDYPTCSLAFNTGANCGLYSSELGHYAKQGFTLVVIFTLPQEIHSWIGTIQSIKNGSKNDLAGKVRDIAKQLKNEMDGNEEFVRQEIAKLQNKSSN